MKAFLDAYSPEFGQVERTLFAAMNRGEKLSELEKILQAERRLSSQDVRNALTRAEANYKSQKKLIDSRLRECQDAIKSIKDSIQKITLQIKALQKLGKKHSSKLAGISKLRQKIHQKKRKLAIKEAAYKRLELLKESGKFSVCFGSKKLFKAQYTREENGYKSHQEWLEDWQHQRSNHIFYEGSKRFGGGNLLCRLTSEGNLTITVPPCLQETFGQYVSCQGISFRYGQEYINAALQPKRYENVSKKTGKSSTRLGTIAPLSHQFIKKDGEWYIHTTVELPEVPYQSHRRNGVLGVDFNPNSVDWAVCDREGNLKAHGRLRLDIQDKPSDATRVAIGKLCAQLVRLAISMKCLISIEKLDFLDKKAQLGEKSAKYARMLSNFAYSCFAHMLERRCLKYGIELIRINPAYSSLQGLTKFMSMYGLNSGTAAALVLARRALRKSERLPRGLQNALKKPVDSFRHVWGAWSQVARLLNTKGGRNRHLFYSQRGEANSLLEVNLATLRGSGEGIATSSSG